MSTIRVDTYDSHGAPTRIDIQLRDGYAVMPVKPTLYMSATELDELAQAAATAARKVREGEF